MKIKGYCPACVEQTLEVDVTYNLEGTGRIVCTNEDCPRAGTLQELLDNEMEHLHVMQLSADGYAMQHPLGERLDGGLFECPLQRHMNTLKEPPKEPGMYTVRPGILDSWVFVPLPTKSQTVV